MGPPGFAATPRGRDERELASLGYLSVRLEGNQTREDDYRHQDQHPRTDVTRKAPPATAHGLVSPAFGLISPYIQFVHFAFSHDHNAVHAIWSPDVVPAVLSPPLWTSLRGFAQS
jgi:hypothetical protein